MVQNAAQTISTGLQNENPGWNGEPLEKAYEFQHCYKFIAIIIIIIIIIIVIKIIINNVI